MHSWRVLLLPYIDQKSLYEDYRFDEPWDGPNNRLLLNRRPSPYALHDRNDVAGPLTNYVAVVGKDTAWPGLVGRCFDEFPNGLGGTILVVENVGAEIAWTEPRDLQLDSMNFDLASHPPDGISSGYEPSGAVMADGLLRKLHAGEVTPARLRQMLLITGAGSNSAAKLEDGRNRPLRHSAK